MGGKQLIKPSLMHNFIANFIKLLNIYKEFAENRAGKPGNFVQARAKRASSLANALPSAAEILQISCKREQFPRKERKTSPKESFAILSKKFEFFTLFNAAGGNISSY